MFSLRQAKTPKDRQLILYEMQARNLQEYNFLMGEDLSNANLREVNFRGALLFDSNLRGANLREADLSFAHLGMAQLLDADLHGAVLDHASLISTNLEGAKHVTREQLLQTWTLEGATLPNGTKLPGRTPKEIADGKPEPPWYEAFEEWCKTVPVDEHGFIIVDD